MYKCCDYNSLGPMELSSSSALSEPRQNFAEMNLYIYLFGLHNKQTCIYEYVLFSCILERCLKVKNQIPSYIHI